MKRVNKPTKDPHCKKCGGVKEGAYAKESMCGSCLSEYRKQKRLEKRLAEGGKPRSEYGSGRSAVCSKCGKEKDDAFKSSGYCRECSLELKKLSRIKKREELGLRPYNSGPNPICACGKPKERPEARECNECHRNRDNAWRLKTGRTLRHRTGLCRCGQPFASYSKCYCSACATRWKKEYLAKNPDQRDKSNKRTRERRFLSFDEYVKYWARYTTGYAIKAGYLVKQPCQVCQSSENIEAHHADYSRPYEITWLCRRHHHEEHKHLKEVSEELKEQKNNHRTRAYTREYIKSGKLVKGACEVCGSTKNVEAHHDDYDKPLEVRWLCRKHHNEHHHGSDEQRT